MRFTGVTDSAYALSIDDLLRMTVERRGSDLHLAVGMPPCIRIHGDLVPVDAPVLKAQDVEHMILSIIQDYQKEKLEQEMELDFSYAVPGCARFRGNVMFQRGTLAAVFRAVPFVIPDFDKLGLPQDIKRLCDLPRGLILVTGPTGSGKSTTLAAMIDLINNTRACNIVTVEDPIEFLHKHKKSSVRQREIGTDTHSFASALRHVLRHDPDIIMIGEMRDQESISIALTAAETGHLVLSTLHTQTAPLTITRIIDSFSEDKRVQIRQQLANSLRAVISQQLIPTIDGKGRVVAVEYMVDTPAIRSMIREGKEHQLYSAIQTGQKDGMQTMDQALVKLFRAGRISRESVLEYCVDRAEVERLIKNAFYDQF
ncbi:MAG TPA: type IV pilus twitching motility protein PilT [Thermoclostridium caenicola]|uniref:Pilus retraction ATPase PilT n=1 Tax=Thermoclostridium caenicola TaxID=659425 RepID=A0A1M6GL74_9FIRM|nr:type IV pilus twitching motility protein PilT [Thermoclostridium caenicola]SHJ10685.1 pilus retraction ATPase PilT [Thermoclostridium caenicola]HOK42329.1 type IV pilus twitching motility protein PilT [Thermoclostridium caenicola]HOL84599.1 type IV pilus twitching motility protein PilT [Thermoclostridium caenicola]HPO76824.1 type IV pilus twitching motility protein PilT [Thermoclostridium caenicola]